MMHYTIAYSRDAARQIVRLRKRDKRTVRRITSAIEAMATDPFAGDVKRMKGMPCYRRRVGDWRIIFDLDDDRIVIEIIRIAHRREAYR